MIALYIVSLAGSAGLFGSFIRQALGEIGYVRGFDMALTLAVGAGLLYACVQLVYMTVVQALKPTRSRGPLIAEAFSHAATLVFLPYLLGMSVNWPHPVLAKIEPLVYLGLFAVLHMFFKLVTFFAAVRGEAGGRRSTGWWLLAATLSGCAAYGILSHWVNMAAEARPRAVAESQYYRVGDQYALGREVPEGATVAVDVAGHDAAGLTLRCAPAPPASPEEEVLERVYVNARVIGDESEDGTWPVALSHDGWGELYLPSAILPSGLNRCELSWDRNRRPTWQRLLGMRPIVSSNGKLLFSGPYLHDERTQAAEPSFLVIVVDGLGSSHMSAFGYKRKTTASLDALVRKSTAFPNAYSPAPETAAACMTLLTGVGPLSHGYLKGHNGPQPETFGTLAEVFRQRMYVTAAFTEGEGDAGNDLAPGSGFERGFEVFDPSYAPVTSDAEDAGSRRTIEKAAKWLDQYANRRFFLFIRLRELGNPVWRPQYAPGVAGKDAPQSAPDVYDNALAYLDKRIGTLITRLRATDAGKNACIIVTSPYGIDFTRKTGPVIGLTEESLRVPLIICSPGGQPPLLPPESVGLDSVAPTVLALAGAKADHAMDGTDLAKVEQDLSPVSVYGSPMVFSMRRERWRFYWHSGVEPSTGKRIEPEGQIEVLEMEPPSKQTRKQNDDARKAALARECMTRFKAIDLQYARKKL